MNRYVLKEMLPDRRRWTAMLFCVGLIAGMVLTSGCARESEITFDTPYQVVFLDNGQVFIGKLEKTASAYPILRDVFYIQRQVEQDKKEAKNILVKRGSEWHGPDFMRINARHIVMIEPVSPNSRVAQLITEAKIARPEKAK